MIKKKQTENNNQSKAEIGKQTKKNIK